MKVRDTLEQVRPAARISDRTRAELRAVFALGVADFALANRADWPQLAAAVLADPIYATARETSAEVRTMLWHVTYLR